MVFIGGVQGYHSVPIDCRRGKPVLSILSPAKTLDYETAPTTKKSTQPLFIKQATSLVANARKMDPEDIQALMGVSENIAALNHARFMNWDPTFTLSNAKQSVLAFKGDVYTGLEANTLSAEELAFAQKHLRILSGLYGLLRPLDLMQPYRLRMRVERTSTSSGGIRLPRRWGSILRPVAARCWSTSLLMSISRR
jgi:cytoplasmic iron level regulating protein YaaA (DUF328/UPF0246 family)